MDYVHHTPARLRVRSAHVRRNERSAKAAEARIASLHGVNSVTANPLTGSITVLYDPKATSGETLLGSLRQCGYTSHARIPDHARAAKLPPVPREIAAAIAKRAAAYVIEAAVERSITALVMAIL